MSLHAFVCTHAHSCKTHTIQVCPSCGVVLTWKSFFLPIWYLFVYTSNSSLISRDLWDLVIYIWLSTCEMARERKEVYPPSWCTCVFVYQRREPRVLDPSAWWHMVAFNLYIYVHDTVICLLQVLFWYEVMSCHTHCVILCDKDYLWCYYCGFFCCCCLTHTFCCILMCGISGYFKT